MLKRLIIFLLLTNIAGVEMVIAETATLPDPTRPANFSSSFISTALVPKQRAEFNVRAIRISETDRSAIVNGKLVRVGDEIGAARVSEIKSFEIVLDYERKLLTIPLYAQSIDKQYKTVVSIE
ncbi:MAG: hypothetical protein GKR93_16910 [Gammaproteobacteria bacterium]|nr:hypothetical protein [Gammaproteobacteria bacterium]